MINCSCMQMLPTASQTLWSFLVHTLMTPPSLLVASGLGLSSSQQTVGRSDAPRVSHLPTLFLQQVGREAASDLESPMWKMAACSLMADWGRDPLSYSSPPTALTLPVPSNEPPPTFAGAMTTLVLCLSQRGTFVSTG